MKYLFEQKSGNVTTLCILENPTVKDGTVYATKVAKFAGFEENDDDTGAREVYRTCSPVEFIAGGGPWNMEEYKGKISE